MRFENTYMIIHFIAQNKVDSKLNGLTDKDKQILKKVEGNTKTVKELGFEFVSFS